MLKPWQGAPPKSTATGRSPILECSRRYAPSISATLRQMVAQSGKLNSCVAQWMGSYSTAAATSNPACSKPRLIPPAPANRSTPRGLFPLPLIKQEPSRMFDRFRGRGHIRFYGGPLANANAAGNSSRDSASLPIAPAASVSTRIDAPDRHLRHETRHQPRVVKSD